MPTTNPSPNPVHWSPDDWQKMFLYAGAFLGILGTFITTILLPSIIRVFNGFKELKQNSVARDQQVQTLDENIRSVHNDQQVAAHSVTAIPDPMPLKTVPSVPNPQTSPVKPA